MPSDELMMPNMPELYHLAVQALNYCEGHAEPFQGDSLSVRQPALSQRNWSLVHGHFSLCWSVLVRWAWRLRYA